MKRFAFLTLGLLIAWALSGQDKPAYRLFHANGKEASYDDLLKKAQKADAFFFGEQHNNPICHWLQMEVTQDLFKEKNGAVILGAEMFERDNQLLLEEYLSGKVNQKNFEDEAKLWNNYATDYKPLVEFAKTKKIPFIGTNVPRRYANLVFRQGLEALDSLSASAKALIAPLPIPFDANLPSYQEMLKMMGGHGAGPVNLNFPKSQAIKDATMGYAISQNLKKGHVFIHYNGSFHSDLKEGTVWYLLKYAPRVDVVTLASVEQQDISQLAEENKNKGDFILVIPATMTKTY
ncbi:MAG: ChaN family lipoprotein [Haliscomenobacter sp.]|nr:ChaN family lipoprotein [Haliscomenobacter sp.]